MDEIIRMQENLLLIRRSVGWTAEEFGDRIGVTRQTINNIEFGRNKLTKTQYIAMRSVLDAEMAQSPDDTTMLRLLLDALIDHPEKYGEAERAEILAKANLMAPAILAGSATRETVSKEWIRSVSAVAGITADVLCAIGNHLNCMIVPVRHFSASGRIGVPAGFHDGRSVRVEEGFSILFVFLAAEGATPDLPYLQKAVREDLAPDMQVL